jgi:hypothetical protein
MYAKNYLFKIGIEQDHHKLAPLMPSLLSFNP